MRGKPYVILGSPMGLSKNLAKGLSALLLLTALFWGNPSSGEEIQPLEGEVPLPPILSPQQLIGHLYDRDLVVLDVRDVEEYLGGHIPGAIPVDPGSLFPYIKALPTEKGLKDLLKPLGVDGEKKVVIYDDGDALYGSLLYFLLTYGGMTRVSLLDGGILAWKREGWPLEWGMRPGKASAPVIELRRDMVIKGKGAMGKMGMVLLDVDPHYPMKGGITVPWWKNLDPLTGNFRSAEDLRTLYRYKGIGEDKEVVVRGNNLLGTTVTYLVLRSLGYRVYLYNPGGR